MYITVLGSRPNAIPSNIELVHNAAGFNGIESFSLLLFFLISIFFRLVSNKYGFGLMDAGLMTWYASGWTNVPNMSTCESIAYSPNKTIAPHANENFFSDFTECQNGVDITQVVNYMEQVQVFVTLKTTNRGEIEIYLYSPSNTKTELLPVRTNDYFN